MPQRIHVSAWYFGKYLPLGETLLMLFIFPNIGIGSSEVVETFDRGPIACLKIIFEYLKINFIFMCGSVISCCQRSLLHWTQQGRKQLHQHQQ